MWVGGVCIYICVIFRKINRETVSKLLDSSLGKAVEQCWDIVGQFWDSIGTVLGQLGCKFGTRSEQFLNSFGIVLECVPCTI